MQQTVTLCYGWKSIDLPMLGFKKKKLSSQEHDDPMAYIHFTAEGEVTFKSILFVPNSAPRGLFDEYGSKKSDFIKVRQAYTYSYDLSLKMKKLIIAFFFSNSAVC